MKKLVCAAAIAVFAWSGDAHSAGIPMDAAQQATLRARIAQARTADPGAFRAVRDIVARTGELTKKARGRRPPIALYLHALGPKALLPMLELLAGDAPKDVPAEALAAARLHVVEAVGLLRDARALPVLGAMLDAPDVDFATARTVTEAIGRMESDEAVLRITTALASARGERARGILAGMGACHRQAIAKALAERLAASPDDATALAIVRSLGDVGNAWAWETLSARGEEHATRQTAARALVGVYVHGTSANRQAASDALMVVDEPTTPALVQAARAGASAEANAALDELLRRFANDPARVSR